MYMPLLYDETNLPKIDTLKAQNYDQITPDKVQPVTRIGVLVIDICVYLISINTHIPYQVYCKWPKSVKIH